MTPPRHGRESERLSLVLPQIGTQNQFPILVVTLPDLHQIHEEYPFLKIHERILKLARESGLHAMDLLPCLQATQSESLLWVTPEDTHPNARANRLIADCIDSDLKPLLRTGSANRGRH